MSNSSFLSMTHAIHVYFNFLDHTSYVSHVKFDFLDHTTCHHVKFLTTPHGSLLTSLSLDTGTHALHLVFTNMQVLLVALSQQQSGCQRHIHQLDDTPSPSNGLFHIKMALLWCTVHCTYFDKNSLAHVPSNSSIILAPSTIILSLKYHVTEPLPSSISSSTRHFSSMCSPSCLIWNVAFKIIMIDT
jgi:hypothetical protein